MPFSWIIFFVNAWKQIKSSCTILWGIKFLSYNKSPSYTHTSLQKILYYEEWTANKKKKKKKKTCVLTRKLYGLFIFVIFMQRFVYNYQIQQQTELYWANGWHLLSVLKVNDDNVESPIKNDHDLGFITKNYFIKCL